MNLRRITVGALTMGVIGALVINQSATRVRAQSATTPELPRVLLNTTYSAPSGTVTTVNAGGDLQTAIENAPLGSTIVLQAGATFTGNFTLPNKSGSGWIYIISSSLVSLPEGARVSPSSAGVMPKIVTTNTFPAIQTAGGAHHFRFSGIEIATSYASTAETTYSVVALEADFSGNGNQSLSDVPHDLVFDRTYIHGNGSGNSRRGITINSASTAVIDSYISEIHETNTDSQAIEGWNGPGPFKIVNNYLSASAENICIGGGDPGISGLIPSDFEIRGNHFFKPMSWQGGPWMVKNLMELKNAQRLLIEGNRFENVWAAGQVGAAVLFTVRNQSGGCPWCFVGDITMRRNVVTHVGQGVRISGTDDNQPSQRTNRILIQDNVFDDVTDALGNGWAFVITGSHYGSEPVVGPDNLAIEHNTILSTTEYGVTDTGGAQNVIPHFVFRNNIAIQGAGFGGGGTGDGAPTLNGLYASPVFTANAIIGGSSSAFSGYPGNVFPGSTTAVGFTDYLGKNYQLALFSPYRNAGTDGRDLGADINLLNTATVCALSGACSGVTLAPGINTQPASQSIAAGTVAHLSVSASGSQPRTFQWYRGTSPDTTTPIAGEIYSEYTTPALTSPTSYWVQVSNLFGTASSATALITVGTAPAIGTQPASQSIAFGGAANLSVSAGGDPPLSYQWYRGTSPSTSNPVPSPTSASLITPALTVTTSYWVRVINAFGSADSTTATVTVGSELGPELVQNGTFTTDASGWSQFELPDMVSSVAGGAFRFHKASPATTASEQATVFQNTTRTVADGQPVTASFDIGNADAVRKRISVLLVDGDFSDMSVCMFWLPANAALRTYQMKTHPTKPWANASIYFYAASTGTGDYLLDNVSLRADSSGSNARTDCIDPTAPPAPGGIAGANLVTNGDFGAATIAPWGTFGDLTNQLSDGVLELVRPGTPGQPAGVLLQNTGQAMAANEILTASFEVGNSSSVRKRVTVLLHDADFSDLAACTFWLVPGQALSTYEMSAFATKPWANATVSVYAASTGPEEWTRLDNVTVRRTPATSIVGTQCVEPAAVSPSATQQFAALAAVQAGRSVAASGSAVRRDGPSSVSVPGRGWQVDGTAERTAVSIQEDQIDLRTATGAQLILGPRLTATLSTGLVQVSIDGIAWEDAASVGPSDKWANRVIDLNPYVGHVIDVRLVFEITGEIDASAWRLDEFWTVVTTEGPSAAMGDVLICP